MASSLDALYQQFLGQVPAGDLVLDDPAFATSPAFPAPSPFASEGMMPTYPMMGMGELPESEMVDPMLGVTSDFGSAPLAASQYGYSPQPRPALPAPVAADEAGLYGPFRGIWEEMQPAAPDPLAALLAQMGPPPEEVIEPRVPALPWQPTRAFGQPPQGRMQDPMPSRNERMLGQQHPRVMERVNWLRGLRAQRGY